MVLLVNSVVEFDTNSAQTLSENRGKNNSQFTDKARITQIPKSKTLKGEKKNIKNHKLKSLVNIQPKLLNKCSTYI